VEVHHVRTALQDADVLTKALPEGAPAGCGSTWAWWYQDQDQDQDLSARHCGHGGVLLYCPVCLDR